MLRVPLRSQQPLERFLRRVNTTYRSATTETSVKIFAITLSLYALYIVGNKMVIGGVVVKVHSDERKDVEIILGRHPELSVYGSDENGNIIATITSSDSASMKAIIAIIEKHDSVISVNLAYLNTER